MNTSAFLTRRARLLMGMSQKQLGDLLNVDAATVSRWESGKLEPNPRAYATIREIAISDPRHSDDLIRASRIMKFIAPIEDLATPLVISRGMTEALESVGYRFEDFTDHSLKISDIARDSKFWDVSGARALELISEHPRWRSGGIAYAEVHAYAPVIRKWLWGMVGPMPDKGTALVEMIEDKSNKEFLVRLVSFDGSVIPLV
jgi:transcriptional regulator with XRE-family HTH domain